jgi:hypothetical protein
MERLLTGPGGFLMSGYSLTLRKALEKKREFTTNHTNLTNKAGISDKKFVFFVWLVVKFLEPRKRELTRNGKSSATPGF